MNYKRTPEEAELIAKTLNYINTHKLENITDIINNAIKILPSERQNAMKKILHHLHYRYHGKIPSDTNTHIDNNVFPLLDTPIKVPIVGKISAGLPVLATENLDGYEYAPSSMIKHGYTYFYLRVQGDSMNLKFNDGDIVLVQQQDYLENDEIGVVLINGFDATVKKYKNENGLVILYPMSTNLEHTVQIYNPKDIDIKIVGKVISYQGKI